MHKKTENYRIVLMHALFVVIASGVLLAQAAPSVIVNWEKKIPNRTVPTLQAVVNPMLRRGSPIHDASLEALHKLGPDYVRYAFWYPYPKMAVAELRPPEPDQTFWDFQYMDPLVEDFLHASEGHNPVFSFSTIPQWMFATPKPVVYPDDPNQVFWDYSQGTELNDIGALADYYARLASWYTQGGFTDELGKFHASGHHYDIRYWEVFNEIDGEHDTTPQQYVERYDAITQAVLKVAPQMKFVALALSAPSDAPRTFAYFLDAKNHKPGVPLDYISFHVYATPSADQTSREIGSTRFLIRPASLSRSRVTSSRFEIGSHRRPKSWSMKPAQSLRRHDSRRARPRRETNSRRLLESQWGALRLSLYAELAKLGIDLSVNRNWSAILRSFPASA